MTRTLILILAGVIATPALAGGSTADAINGLSLQLQFEGQMQRMQQERLAQPSQPVINIWGTPGPAPLPREICNEWLHHPTMSVEEKNAASIACWRRGGVYR